MLNTFSSQKRGFLSLTLTAFILGTFGLLIRALAPTFSDAGQVIARSFVATTIISLIIFYKKLNPLKINKKQIKYILAFCITFPLSILAFTISANSIKVTNALFMLYVGSLFSTAIFGKFLFKEKFTFKHIASLILVLIGLTFFIYPFSIQSISFGLIFGILSGLLEGSSHTLRKLMSGIKREVIVFYQSMSGAIIALLFFLVGSEPLIKEFHFASIPVAIIFGFLLVAIGYLLVYGFENFDVNLGTIILATELFFALVINAIFLKEIPTTYEIIGGLFIFSGTVITSLKLGSKKTP